MKNDTFEAEYKKLNPLQKEAVDKIDGPVMVVAGPGTGKTQVLAMRIANILKKTDIKADGILCLTFTNSAVDAMRERLKKYVGKEVEKVNVSTFHSFGMRLIEECYPILKLKEKPRLLDDVELVTFYDELLLARDWEYLRPRSDAARYFRDLRSLISLLKRKSLSPKDIKRETAKEEGLERAHEFGEFFELYEKTKKERNLFDFDDVLESLVAIAQKSESFCADIRERFLYVLIDEHQDSSGIQNQFLEKIWGEVEKPNIFVVGDDRQLIYGFGGASIAYFKKFTKVFEGAKLISLVENYRSTGNILKIADALLESALSDEKLVSHHKENHPIRLVEAESKEAEIILCGEDLKDKLKKGVDMNDCAILVPKNREVRHAAKILREMGLPVAPGEYFNFFDSEEGAALTRVLKVIDTPEDNVSFAMSLLDRVSSVSTPLAHKFLVANDMRRFSLLDYKNGLFAGEVESFISRLQKFIEQSKKLNISEIVDMVGAEFPKEITHTLSELVKVEKEKHPDLNLKEFLKFLDRLEDYGEAVPIKVLGDEGGIKIMTLHGSKGLEFDYVWIAHMDEKSLTSERRQAFTLPESIREVILERDEEVVKRELYVAITRTKRFCTISYAEDLAQIIQELPKELLNKEIFSRQEKIISKKKSILTRKDLEEIARAQYKNKYVSASLLNTFFECPRKWYFRNILGMPEPKAPALEFGSAVHAAIDQVLKLNKIVLPKDREVAKIVKRWAENRLPQISKNRENEKSVSKQDKKFLHLNIYGKIDLIEILENQDKRVTDFKTGSVKKKYEIEKLDAEGRMSAHLRQLAMYAYLLGARDTRLEFLEAKMDEKAIYDRVITQKEIELLLKDIADYDHLANSGEWILRECHYNSYGRGTECEYCKMFEI